MKDLFIAYLEFSSEIIQEIKSCIEDESYIDASYKLGQLQATLKVKIDQLEEEG